MNLREIEASRLEQETGILRKLRDSTDLLEEHVVPIFHESAGRLLAAGSGVLARQGERFYLISAAHVLDHCETGVFCPSVSGRIERLDNDPVVTARPPGRTREDDRIDIGFVRLTASEASGRGVRSMVDLDAVASEPLPVETTMFAVLGFPLRDHRRADDGEGLTGTMTALYLGCADSNVVATTGGDPLAHLVLRLDRRSIATAKSKGSPPNLAGLSGGGVWPVRLEVSSGPRVPCFGGIVIQKSKNGRALIVTRGTVVRAFVRRFDTAA